MPASEPPIVSRSAASPHEKPLELVDEASELLVVGVDGAEHGVEVVDGATDDGVAVGERRR